jgi:hypothetical protein
VTRASTTYTRSSSVMTTITFIQQLVMFEVWRASVCYSYWWLRVNASQHEGDVSINLAGAIGQMLPRKPGNLDPLNVKCLDGDKERPM